jgi:hypothetical protein
MKRKGKCAWLITWEGTEAEFNGRCKIVAILPPQCGESTIQGLLPVLYRSESNMTLDEKSMLNLRGKDQWYLKTRKEINIEMHYGDFGKRSLCARKVKNLRIEENPKDMAETTIYWTELEKFMPNPDFDNNGPMPADLSVLTVKVCDERDDSYTYSIQPALDEFKRRRYTGLPSQAE